MQPSQMVGRMLRQNLQLVHARAIFWLVQEKLCATLGSTVQPLDLASWPAFACRYLECLCPSPQTRRAAVLFQKPARPVLSALAPMDNGMLQCGLATDDTVAVRVVRTVSRSSSRVAGIAQCRLDCGDTGHKCNEHKTALHRGHKVGAAIRNVPRARIRCWFI